MCRRTFDVYLCTYDTHVVKIKNRKTKPPVANILECVRLHVCSTPFIFPMYITHINGVERRDNDASCSVEWPPYPLIEMFGFFAGIFDVVFVRSKYKTYCDCVGIRFFKLRLPNVYRFFSLHNWTQWVIPCYYTI